MNRSKTKSAASETAEPSTAPVTLPGPVAPTAPAPRPTPAGTRTSAPEADKAEDTAAASPTTAPADAPAGSSLERSRAGAVWVGAVAAAIVVVALIVFIAQNSQKVTIHFVGLHGHFSLALALLVTAVGGILLVAIPGTVRILQLRRVVKKQGSSR